MSQAGNVLVYAHIGDLHITTKYERNYQDLLAIVAELKGFEDALDFVVLPGDLAENGTVAQYELVDLALSNLKPQHVHAITGDHDMEQGTLSAFRQGLSFAKDLPFAKTYKGVRCIFLDMCGAGEGGLDFRLTEKQRDRLDKEVAAHERCAVFMHTYPIDLTLARERLATIKSLASDHVLVVDIGHTHYNELSNDGRKIYAATRSTGQIEEAVDAKEPNDPVGYSIVTIDGKIVSWRFRPLNSRGPIVLVTSPADRRLATAKTKTAKGTIPLRATVLSSRGIGGCNYSVDGAQPVPFTGIGPHFSAAIAASGARAIAVEAWDDDGNTTVETIELTRPEDLTRLRHADGSDADRLDRWIERGILGTQLGPNRNGHPW